MTWRCAEFRKEKYILSEGSSSKFLRKHVFEVEESEWFFDEEVQDGREFRCRAVLW